jgi:hypothetical protein
MNRLSSPTPEWDADACQTETAARRSERELEERLAAVTAALADFVRTHDADEMDLAREAGMSLSYVHCDCDLCKAARPFLAGRAGREVAGG